MFPIDRRLTLAVLCLLLAALADAASWPVFRADARRSGAARELATGALAERWSFAIQGECVSSPVYDRGIVYIGGRDRSLWAFDAATGEPVWQQSTQGWVDATPCVSSNAVIVPSRDGSVYAFDRLDGTLLWRTATGAATFSSPVVYQGNVYVLSGAPEERMYVLSTADGTLLHAYAVSRFGGSSPAVSDGKLFYGTSDGVLACMELASGQVRWSRPTQGGIQYHCIAADAAAVYAVVGGDERKLYCLDPADGSILWESVEIDTQTSAVSSVALSDDRVYLVSTYVTDDQGTSVLKALAFPRSGITPVAPLGGWPVTLGAAHPSGIVASPALANSALYVASGDGYLIAIDTGTAQYIRPADGALTALTTGHYLSFAGGGASTGAVASPCVADGSVYAASYDGRVWAFTAAAAAAIASPDNAAVVTGTAAVTGTARTPGFDHYALAYGAGATPATWTALATGTAPVDGAALGVWDASALDDGTYTLRMLVNDLPSSEARATITVDNAPQPPTAVSVEDTPFDGGGALTVAWERSPDDGAGDGDVAGYVIYRSTYDGGYTRYAARTTAAPLRYADTGAPPDTTYYYIVRAADARSESRAPSAAAAASRVDGIEITPETGGTITHTVGGLTTEVVFPPGAVDATVRAGIRVPDTVPDTGIPSSARVTSAAREFGVTPTGTVFRKPVTIKIPYAAAQVAGMERRNLRIWWWDEEKAEWRIVNTSDPLSEDGRVWAQVPHFSLYRVMEYIPGREEFLAPGSVYAYPNPATGGTATFKFKAGDQAEASVDVYNVAGELVAHLEKSDCPAGIVSEIPWDIGGIASGVYVYRLELRSGGRTAAITKKMAVIH